MADTRDSPTDSLLTSFALLAINPYDEIVPPEITELIVQFLSNDQSTLLSCSLLSTQWLPHCRRYAFQSVNLTQPMAAERTLELCTLLQSPLSTIKPSTITSLSINYTQITVSALAPYVTIRRLSLQGTCGSTIMDSALPALSHTLTHVFFDNICHIGPFNLFGPLSESPNLRSIRFRQLDFFIDEPKNTYLLPPSWDTLVVDEFSLRFLNWLVEQENRPSLKTLNFTMHKRFRATNSVSAAYRCFSNSLEHVTAFKGVDIPANSHLKEITIYVDSENMFDGNDDWFGSLLQNIPSSASIETIRFRLDFPQRLGTIQKSRKLDEFLSPMWFPQLGNVVFAISKQSRPENVETLRAEYVQTLPSLLGRVYVDVEIVEF